MELRDHLLAIWRRRWIVILAMAIGVAGGLGLAVARPLYASSASLYVPPPPRPERPADAAAIDEADAQIRASYVELLQSQRLARRVRDVLELDMPVSGLRERVSAFHVSNSRLIAVSVRDPSPTTARRIADSYVAEFLLEAEEAFSDHNVRASVFERAGEAEMTVGLIQRPVLGGLLGLLFAAGGSVLLDESRGTIRSRRDLERAIRPTPVLASITPESGAGPEFQILRDPSTAASEDYRILSVRTLSLAPALPVSILVAGVDLASEAARAATNLAASTALAGHRTLFVDADVRTRGFSDVPGMRDAVREGRDPADVVREGGHPNLWVLPSGSQTSAPSEHLVAPGVASFLKGATELAEVMIVLAATPLAFADALVLAPHINVALLVARCGQTTHADVRSAIGRFSEVGTPVIGVVLLDASAR